MTWKQKMEIEQPDVTKRFVQHACPGTYFEGAPHVRDSKDCTSHATCEDCWNREIPCTEKSEMSTDVILKKIPEEWRESYEKFVRAGFTQNQALAIILGNIRSQNILIDKISRLIGGTNQ